MKETGNPQKLLEEATREELSACVQLLAQSLVQHRARFGMVTLQKSTDSLLASQETGEEPGLFFEGGEVLEEALEIVRTLAAESAAREIDDNGGDAEARTQLRINAAVPIKIMGSRHTKPVDARLINISWGGAAFHCDEELDTDEDLRVLLPRPQGGSISVEARVLRVWEEEGIDNARGASVRFSSLGTRDEAKLEAVLEHLVQSVEEEGQRMHARLAQRLDLEFNGVQDLKSTLDDISAGGLRITVPDPLQVGQSLQTVISTMDESCSLKLRARVVRQRAIKLAHGEFYQVGLKFEHPTEELGKRVQELLAKIATIRND